MGPRDGERPSPDHPAGYGSARLSDSHTSALSTVAPSLGLTGDPVT